MTYWQKDIKCEEVGCGTYQCTYAIYVPWLYEDDSKKEPKLVNIDKCLLPEILKLWEMGIKTTGCCCGHGNKNGAFIGVDEDNVQKMKDLGYQVQYNPLRPDDEDSFVPKAKLNYGMSKCTEY